MRVETESVGIINMSQDRMFKMLQLIMNSMNYSEEHGYEALERMYKNDFNVVFDALDSAGYFDSTK